MDKPTPLNGRVVVVTGAYGAIGRAATLRLAADAPRAIVALDVDPAVAALETPIREAGCEALCLPLDCTREADVVRTFSRIEDVFARVDVLVNVVGGAAPDGKFTEFWNSEPSSWRHAIDMSLVSAMLCTRQVVGGMRERRSGRIINIASSIGTVPAPTLVPYGAAKAGVIAFTRGLALELAPYGVNVNVVSPGPIDTPGMARLPEEVRQRNVALVPLGRMGRPEEVADAIAFLATDASSFITGHNLAVNGGKVVQ